MICTKDTYLLSKPYVSFDQTIRMFLNIYFDGCKFVYICNGMRSFLFIFARRI